MALQLHELKHIHRHVVFYICFLIFFFFVVTPFVIPFMYHGRFFSIKMPVVIFDYSVIYDQYVVMVICFCLFTITIISTFITEIATYESHDDNLAKKICDVFFHWFAFVIKNIFIRSHILFTGAVFIADIIGYGWVIDRVVNNREAHQPRQTVRKPLIQRKIDTSNLDATAGDSDTESETDTGSKVDSDSDSDSTKEDDYFIKYKEQKHKKAEVAYDFFASEQHKVFSLANFHGHAGFIQLALVCLSFCLLVFSDVTDSFFMNVGSPITILNKKIETDVGYVMVDVFLFFDRLLFMAMELTVERWMKDDVLNIYSESGFTNRTTYFLYIMRIFIKYIRFAITVSVVFSQFIFVFMYISADIISVIIHHYNRKKTQEHKRSDVLFYSFLYIIESIIFIVVVCSNHVWADNPYFNWFSSVNFFGNIVSDNGQLAYLLVFTGLFQLGVTLMRDVGMVDMWNWLNHKNSDVVSQYSTITKKTVMVVNRINEFLVLVFLLQFLFGNIFFIIVNMAANMSISIAVLAYHIQLKKKKKEIHSATTDFLTYLQSAAPMFRSDKQE